MYFLYPAFLFALATLLIPIIIHLFRFRRFKTVYFTNVRFLKQVEQRTATYSRLKHWLILLARLLTLLFLVLAFAQPYLPLEEGTIVSTRQTQNVSVYVDNSFSMSATGKGGTLLEEAKEKARQIIDAYRPSSQYQLLTNEFKGEHQHFVDQDQFLTNVEEVNVSQVSRSMGDVVKRQQQALQAVGQTGVSYLISDFQKNSISVEALARDTSLDISLIPLKSNVQNNVYIDTCWFDIPILRTNHVMKLNARVKNEGTKDVYNVRLALRENNQIKAITNFDIQAGETVVDTLSFTLNKAGWHTGTLTLKDHPITFDNDYFVSYQVVPHISVLTINQEKESPYLNAIFKEDDYFVLNNTTVGQLNYSGFSNYQLIILNGLQQVSSGLASELQKFVQRGGDILIFPSLEADLQSYRQLLNQLQTDYYTALLQRERQVGKVNVQSDVFQGVFNEIPENVDLPRAQQSFQLTDKTRTQREELLVARDGRPMVASYAYQQGTVYLSAIPLDREVSNLVTHAVFVPMVYKMALLSNNPKPLAYTIGKDRSIQLDERSEKAEQLYRLQRQDFEIIPEQKTIGSQTLLMFHDQIKEAGIYTVTKDERPSYQRKVAFNYDRQESALSYLSAEDLQEQTNPYPHLHVLNTIEKSVSQSIQAQNKGQPLWKWCVLLTLLFIAAEILLIRFWPDPQLAQS